MIYRQNLLTKAVGKRDQQILNMLHDTDDLDFIGRSLDGSELVIGCCVEVLPAARQFVLLLPTQNLNTLADDADQRLSELAELTLSVYPPVSDGFLSNACALRVGMHRLLIQPDSTPENSRIPYRLFSCVLDGSNTCSLRVILIKYLVGCCCWCGNHGCGHHITYFGSGIAEDASGHQVVIL